MTKLLTTVQMFIVKHAQGIHNNPERKSYNLLTEIIFITLLLLLIFSCARDKQISTPAAGLQLKKIAGSNPPVIEVYPGGNDSGAFIEAFRQAKSLGKGSIVKLMPGEFKIGMTEVREFFGKLTGSGKEKTVITNLPGLTPVADTTLNKLPALITFIGGDVSVSDLTLKTSGDSIPWLDSAEMSMILFSDYAADFTPTERHINVNINNINVETTFKSQRILFITTPDTGYLPWPVIMAPVMNFTGIKVAPDILKMTKQGIKRTNADVNISNSFFSGFDHGVFIWGCQKGQLNFGIQGGNLFDANSDGLRINNCFDIEAKVANNTFKVHDTLYDGLDINAGEAELMGIEFEDVPGELGDYKVTNNIFYIDFSTKAIGVMDVWRCVHPDNPLWINLVIQNNIIHATSKMTCILASVNLKNSLIINNTVTGNDLRCGMFIGGMYFLGNHPDNSNYFSEGIRILNNKILHNDFIIDIKWDTRDCMIGGDLSNVFIADQGSGSRYVGIYKNGYSSAISKDVLDKMWKRYYGKK
jgi:hypothetical protein